MISVGKSLQFKYRTYFYFLYLFSMILFLTSAVLCQDSLYLIGTITGESYAKRITEVKGIGDVNGDGYDDFMVTTNDKTVKLYLGSANFTLTPSVIFHYPDKDSLYEFGGCIGIGDVNGDGYDDFTINGSFYDGGYTNGKVFIYYGGPRVDTLPKYIFHGPGGVFNIGDINKDGYNDFAISQTYNWSNGKGMVYLFWGGDTISFARNITFVDTQAIGKPIDSFFGTSVANIGDVIGDGFDDIAISAGYSPSETSEKVYIFYGGMKMDTIPDTVLTSNNLDYDFGRIIKNAGDLNKDGVTDFCIAGGSKVFVYKGRDNLKIINASTLGLGGYVNLETNCDMNHDGFGDFVIGNTNHRNSDSVMVGGAFVYFGGKNIDTVYKFKLEGENKWDEFSKIMSTADINGDGYDELFILSPGYPDYNNPLGKVYIYSYKKLTEVKENKQTTPYKFDLYQNYPNPFNQNTIISYQLPVASYVSLKVYDILGKKIKTLVYGLQKAGKHTKTFDGSSLSSGVYFYRLTVGQFATQKSMMLVK